MGRCPGGIICPLTTPLGPEGELDEAVLQQHIEALLPDLDGVFILGSSGEMTWLSDNTADRVARVAFDYVAGRLPIYVGVGDTSTVRTLHRIENMAGYADFLVVTTPFYYPVDSDDQLVRYFETIADKAPKPVLLYNIPQNTQNHLSVPLVSRLAGHDNIVGIKDSAGDPFVFAEYLGLRSETFAVMQGREQLTAQSYWAGADGLISAMANFAPRLLRALQTAVRTGAGTDVIFGLQAEVTSLARVFDEGYWLAALKAAVSASGFPVGDPSHPLTPVTPSGHRRIINRLSTVGAEWITRNTTT